MREAVRQLLESSSSQLTTELGEWWAVRSRERVVNHPKSFISPLRRAVIDTIERGLSGQPTREHLQALEFEVERAANAELEAHISALPFKVLIPLLLFYFPAFLLLLLGPLLRDLSQKMGG